ncbi:AKR_HP2_G0023580.mRNA.1.CDS.1 [Saccharomyces cerevisiae]|nr:AKR_HP2_G0023580.mRNA.1.CDS.1 [Saccharomyces cerevisiae]CAI6473323.1 AKR_HP2_G0023580.mRNA.1.CDS.1 [Saccharomyces cerevisiae]
MGKNGNFGRGVCPCGSGKKTNPFKYPMDMQLEEELMKLDGTEYLLSSVREPDFWLSGKQDEQTILVWEALRDQRLFLFARLLHNWCKPYTIIPTDTTRLQRRLGPTGNNAGGGSNKRRALPAVPIWRLFPQPQHVNMTVNTMGTGGQPDNGTGHWQR